MSLQLVCYWAVVWIYFSGKIIGSQCWAYHWWLLTANAGGIQCLSLQNHTEMRPVCSLNLVVMRCSQLTEMCIISGVGKIMFQWVLLTTWECIRICHASICIWMQLVVTTSSLTSHQTGLHSCLLYFMLWSMPSLQPYWWTCLIQPTMPFWTITTNSSMWLVQPVSNPSMYGPLPLPSLAHSYPPPPQKKEKYQPMDYFTKIQNCCYSMCFCVVIWQQKAHQCCEYSIFFEMFGL
jgi:hypothetical protein